MTQGKLEKIFTSQRVFVASCEPTETHTFPYLINDVDLEMPDEGDNDAAAAMFEQIDEAARTAVEFEGLGTHVPEQRLTDEGECDRACDRAYMHDRDSPTPTSHP